MVESNGNGVVESAYPPNLQNTQEIPDGANAVVSGSIPSWLKGSMLTCGAGMFHFKEGSVKHLLDGMAMLSKISINGESSTVSVVQKYLKSKAFERSMEAGKPCTTLMGTPFVVQPLRPFGPYEFTDNCLGPLHEENKGEIFLQSDGSTYFFQIDPETLEPIEKNHYLKMFSLYSMRPLPLEDENGDLYNLGGTITGSLQCQILRMKKENRSKPLKERWDIICQIPSRMKTSGSILRCFGMSKNYVVFVEQPAVVNAMKMTATYIKQYAMMDWLEWHPDFCNRFHVVSKETGAVIKTEFLSFAAFYGVSILNAFEDGNNNLVVDCIALPNTDIMKALLLENLTSPDESMGNIYSGSIVRYVIPLIEELGDADDNDNYIEDDYDEAQAIRKGDKVVLIPEVITIGVDFAIANKNYTGKPYKYAYAINSYARKGAEVGNCVMKVDLETQETKYWKGLEGQVPSYPIFIPNPDAESEDDGVLIFGVTAGIADNNENEAASANSVVFMDAKSFTEIARASFKDKIVAAWIHGIFLPQC
ncbi:Beta,beta-carotene 15,15'-monooxygenase [Orchesella cincta]|uniref:Beta,beta-carotene 15,15'-monooxygenase n=1 Tax=Orchesella cincta TaxID=48709 RepID=A0A1D2MNS0_ORCCI|nr:Beta,beta-carotene 15,15'-monooxygenase [Orchesella cincta]